jgi:ATP-binding cassette subfamily C protein
MIGAIDRWRRLPTPVAALARELAGGAAAALFVTVFLNLAVLFVPIYDMILYDRVLQSRNLDTITVLTIGCALGMVLYGLLEYFRAAIFAALGDRIGRRLNVPALKGALERSLRGDPHASAQAMRDVGQLRMFASSMAMAVPFDLLWTPALLTVLFMLHPAYGVYATAACGVLALTSVLTDLATRRALLEASDAHARTLAELSASLRQSELVDGMGLLPEIAGRWRRRGDARRAELELATRRAKAFAAASRALRLGLQMGVMSVGVVLVLAHEATPGSMMGANLMVARLLYPFDQLVSGWREWMGTLAAWRRILALVADAEAHRDGTRREPVAGGPVLAVRNLGFTPPGMAEPVLQDVSFTLDAGEVMALVGPSGAGKSTLARLIVGLFRPTAGHVEIEGHDVAEWEPEALGARIGYLPQAVGLLDGTVLDNVSRMTARPTSEAIEAATRAGVHQMIGRLPNGYGTFIGASGHVLSGGQRQRIGLTRALFGEPRLLVLDEPNSNLDHLGEAALADAVADARRRGAAVLLVTHRPAALALADHVLTLRNGRMAGLAPGPAAAPAMPPEAAAS